MYKKLQQQALYEFGSFRLIPAEKVLLRDGRPVTLTPKVFDILQVLVEEAGHLVEKDELLRRIWGDTFIEEATLAKNVSTLRKILGEAESSGPDGNGFVETVPRRGYRFVAPVKKVEASLDEGQLPVAGASVSEMTLPDSPAGELPQRIGGVAIRRPWTRLWRVAALFTALGVVAAAAYLAGQGFVPRSPAAAPANRVTLAVMPFQNLSGELEQEYLSDGLTEEMIMHMARLSPEHLGVIARTSSMQFKHSKKSVAQIGQELSVDYVLEGSLRRDGSRLRVSAQLIQVRDQTHLWAQNYERDVGDLLAVQDDVARAIASEIRLRLEPQLPAKTGRGTDPRAVLPEVHHQYLKGRYFWNKRTEAGYVKAIEYFEQAIQGDRDYAPAYAGLADAYALLGSMTNSTIPRLEAMPRARAFAEKALSLDESLAEAHTSLAFVKMHFEQDWANAEREFRRAITLNPSYVTAHHWYAYCLIAQNRVEEALREIRRAQELDPLSLIINTDVAELLYLARRHDEAIRQAQKTLEMDPSFALAQRVLGLAYQEKGMHKESIAAMQTLVRISGSAEYALAALGRSYALSGNRKPAEKLLRDLLALKPKNSGGMLGPAILHAALGDKDKALAWLEKLSEERAGIILIRVEPYFDSLRSEPRFRDLERRMKLTKD